MKLSAFKKYTTLSENLVFELWNGERVPAHYHLTEIGLVEKNYIDCGGKIRQEKKISLQLRTADDTDHRLTWEKTRMIIDLFEEKISSVDAEIEIEYQWTTIGKYSLEFENNKFILIPTRTDCLAKDTCGIPEKTPESCCGGGCC